MKRTVAVVGSCLVSLAVHADGPPPFKCPATEGWLMWSLTATPYAETPIFAGNQNTRVAAVCNCTETTAAADSGVWVATLQPDKKTKGKVFGRALMGAKAEDPPKTPPKAPPPPEPIDPGPGQDFYYLPGGSCTIVGPGSVMLMTADRRAAKWGVWKLQP